MNYEDHLHFAREMDNRDPLKKFRNKFYIPIINGKETKYFAGNSLGLQPKTTQDYILKELENWANFGVEGHFHIKEPWYSYHDFFPEKLSKILGCRPQEIAVMNQLTINLHLLMITFYRPTRQRYKIICEAKSFPSDQYVFESQVKLHGFSPAVTIIEIEPRQNEFIIKMDDIIDTIEKHKSEVALVIFGGVNYYNGQVLNMKAITKAAHAAGAYCGFDLAHAVGNIELKLHEWDVDFACWCTYKYLNSGPGSIAGAFINERFVTNTTLPRLTGWWGYEKSTRFKMEKGFKGILSAEGWQVSNPSIIDMASHRAAVDIFDEAGFDKLVARSKKMTGYALFIVEQINTLAGRQVIKVLTPTNDEERGCQLSMLLMENGKKIFDGLKENGIIGDWREPNVIRIAPVPLYNTYEDIYWFGAVLKRLILLIS